MFTQIHNEDGKQQAEHLILRLEEHSVNHNEIHAQLVPQSQILVPLPSSNEVVLSGNATSDLTLKLEKKIMDQVSNLIDIEMDFTHDTSLSDSGLTSSTALLLRDALMTDLKCSLP